MARKRDQLLQLFPPGTVTASQAPDALRHCHGNLDLAFQYLEGKTVVAGVGDDQHEENSQTKTSSNSTNDKAEVPISFSASKNKENKAKNSDQIEKEDRLLLINTKKSMLAVNASTSATSPKPANLGSDSQDTTRRPPSHSMSINNLSDRQYCCVWWVEVYEDGYRPDLARALLARVARHVNPILRGRGWRVKRLIESASTRFLGCCVTNGRGDADAASANIQLNLRRQPNKQCRQFRSFRSVLSVMLHEITHISIGLEDIHPPAFWELLEEIKGEYRTKLVAGEVNSETETYGCRPESLDNNNPSNTDTEESTAIDGQNCGAGKGRRRRRRYKNSSGKRTAAKAMGIQAAQQAQKRRPLLKGAKMVDKRTVAGKASVAELQNLCARELAARAALERLDGGNASSANTEMISDDRNISKEAPSDDRAVELLESDSDDDDIEEVADHPNTCACRACQWDNMLCQEMDI